MPAASLRTWAERSYGAVAIASFTFGPVYYVRVRWSSSGPLAEDGWVIAWMLALQAVAAVLLVTGVGGWRHLWRGIAASGRVASVGALALAGFGAWLVLTSLGSADVVTTVVRCVQLAVTPAFGAWLWWRFGPVERLAVLSAGLHVGLAGSALQIWRSVPGATDVRGDWVGIFFNRNSLAPVAVLGAISALGLVWQLARCRRGPWIVAAAVAALAALIDTVLAVGAGSRTSLGFGLASITVALFLVMAQRLRWPREKTLIGTGAFGVAVVAAAWFTRGSWLGAFDEDRDLTGRVPVWGVLARWAGERPLTGYGYLSLWGHDDRFAAEQEAVNNGASLTSAHNSGLEALLGGGIPALVLLLVAVGAAWYVAACTVWDEPAVAHPAVAAWVAVWSFGVSINVLETLIVPHALVWTISAGVLLAPRGCGPLVAPRRGGRPRPTPSGP